MEHDVTGLGVVDRLCAALADNVNSGIKGLIIRFSNYRTKNKYVIRIYMANEIDKEQW